MGNRDMADLLVTSLVRLLKAHGEAYPGATQDAADLEAAWEAEKAGALDGPGDLPTPAAVQTLREVAGDLDAALNGPDYRNDRERMDEVARIVARIETVSQADGASGLAPSGVEQ